MPYHPDIAAYFTPPVQCQWPQPSITTNCG